MSAIPVGGSVPGHEPRTVRATRGNTITTKHWTTEAAKRMLMNNLDPDVAERPEDLVVYGGTGRAARNWLAFDAIVAALDSLEPNETLLVQSGKPVGIFTTHEWAPRVLIANSNLVGEWANWPEFRTLEAEGLTMYGQMTAGSWIYIGSQGILQGTYETFGAVARERFNGTLAGTVTLTGGCGGMGGAQPLAVTLNEGAVLIVDVDAERIQRRVDHGYLDEMTHDLDDALERVLAAKAERRALSVGLVGNAATVFTEILDRGIHMDIVTDQTSAHDPLSYLPEGESVESWLADAAADPESFTQHARAAMAKQVKAMVEFQDRGSVVFDYGNSIRREAELGGYDRAFDFPGFVPAYIRPLFAEGKGPFRWVALSGDPADIAATDKAIVELFPEDEHLRRWIEKAGDKVHFEGLPARICWLGYKERHLAGLRFNEMVKNGEVRLPSSSGAITSTRVRLPPPIAKPRRCWTAPTRSPTGPSSTHSSTRRAAQPGCLSTTVAVSESAAPFTVARCSSSTEPTSPLKRFHESSSTTREPVSCVTSTRATTARPRWRANADFACPCGKSTPRLIP